MTRAIPALGCAGLAILALLWSLEPVAALVLPPVGAGLGVGLAGCLTAVGVGVGGALLLVGAGLAVRAARGPADRPALLYPGEPPRAELIEGEYTYE